MIQSYQHKNRKMQKNISIVITVVFLKILLILKRSLRSIQSPIKQT